MITSDRGEAAEAAGRGEPVVLIVPAATEGRASGTRPGRLAVLVGDPGDPAIQTAAAAMEAELYGPRTEG